MDDWEIDILYTGSQKVLRYNGGKLLGKIIKDEKLLDSSVIKNYPTTSIIVKNWLIIKKNAVNSPIKSYNNVKKLCINM